jgi:hypothetical protein
MAANIYLLVIYRNGGKRLEELLADPALLKKMYELQPLRWSSRALAKLGLGMQTAPLLSPSDCLHWARLE